MGPRIGRGPGVGRGPGAEAAQVCHSRVRALPWAARCRVPGDVGEVQHRERPVDRRAQEHEPAQRQGRPARAPAQGHRRHPGATPHRMPHHAAPRNNMPHHPLTVPQTLTMLQQPLPPLLTLPSTTCRSLLPLLLCPSSPSSSDLTSLSPLSHLSLTSLTPTCRTSASSAASTSSPPPSCRAPPTSRSSARWAPPYLVLGLGSPSSARSAPPPLPGLATPPLAAPPLAAPTHWPPTHRSGPQPRPLYRPRLRRPSPTRTVKNPHRPPCFIRAGPNPNSNLDP